MNEQKWGWGIIGAGSIAGTFAKALQTSETGKLVSVGSRSQVKADEFIREYGGARGYGSYEEVLQDADVQAVYIALPHPMHAEWCVRAAEAGKHILCEKPLTLTAEEADEVFAAVRRNDVFLMEAFMYRCHPQTAKLVELIRAERIGKVGLIQATFSFHSPYRAEGRLFAQGLGGGGILDVGCYTTSVARLLAGAANGKPLCEPKNLTSRKTMHHGVDIVSVAVAEFEGDILAQLSCGVGLKQENGVWIYGSEGMIEVPNPFLVGRDGEDGEIQIVASNGTREVLKVPSGKSLYALEVDVVGRALTAGLKETAEVSWEDTIGNMAALDAWRVVTH